MSIDEEIRSQISNNSKAMPKSYPINDVFVEYIDPYDVIRVHKLCLFKLTKFSGINR